MKIRNGNASLFCVIRKSLGAALFALFLAYPVLAAESPAAESPATQSPAAETPAVESPAEKDGASGTTQKGSSTEDPLVWVVNHVLQTMLNWLIWPVSEPLHYAFDNGVFDTAQDLVTFGEKRNIFVYPVFNLKPGSSTLLGFSYRHRSMLLSRDYFFFGPSYFANGDFSFVTRYTKQNVSGLPVFIGWRFALDWDSDASFTLPNSWTSYVQPDSSVGFSSFLGFPLNTSRSLNLRLNYGVRFVRANVPSVVDDSIYISDKFRIQDRGLYQDHSQVPLGFSFVFDNLDFPYAPSKGNRLEFALDYNIVHKYKGVRFVDLESEGFHEKAYLEDGGLNHDYISGEFFFQHYFYLGQSPSYVMSAKEGRKNRKFYTDFSWDEALRIWRPENVMETLLERRVIALQFRMNSLFEIEKGGAPFNAFPRLNARYPLRGYGGILVARNLMGLSTEYRWPVDRYIDGVIFNEYVMYSDKINDWSFDRLLNSWGFGVRVRKPDMYLFRVQFGFHGLHGVNMVMTIAPEYK